MSDWTPIDSSMISGVKYDAGSQDLHVRFKNGAVYIYEEVPPEDADGLIHASSPGSFLHDSIKDQYSSRRG